MGWSNLNKGRRTKSFCNRFGATAPLVLGALLVSACQGDRLNSPSADVEPRTRVFVDGEMRDVSLMRGSATSTEVQFASKLGELSKLKPLNIRSTARRASTVASTWLDAQRSIQQVVTYDTRGLPKTVQVRTPHGVLLVENEYEISGNTASVVRQVIKSGDALLVERTSVRRTALSEVPMSGFYAIGNGIGRTVSACMAGLGTILSPRNAYASTVEGDPCITQSQAAGSAHRKAALGAAAAGATCAATGGLLCGLAIAIELDVIHDAVVAEQALEQCRADHPEYVPPPPCTAFCH